MKNNIHTILVGFGVLATVLVTLSFWIGNAGALDLYELGAMFGVLVIAIVAAYVVIKRTRDIKAGFNPDDELAKKAGWKAGYYAYLASVWTAVGVMWLNIFLTETYAVPDFTMGQVIGAIVIIPGIVFLGLALLFRSKGNVE